MIPPYPIPPFRITFLVKDIRNGEVTRVEDDVIIVAPGGFITAGNIPGVGVLDPEFCELVDTNVLEEPSYTSHELDL